jgi:hypothetical protein
MRRPRTTWLCIEESSDTGQCLRAWMHQQGLRIEPAIQLDSFDLIINLVALGMGISIVPNWALALYGRKKKPCSGCRCRSVSCVNLSSWNGNTENPRSISFSLSPTYYSEGQRVARLPRALLSSMGPPVLCRPRRDRHSPRPPKGAMHVSCYQTDADGGAVCGFLVSSADLTG